jgi:hypothetical protein
MHLLRSARLHVECTSRSARQQTAPAFTSFAVAESLQGVEAWMPEVDMRSKAVLALG